MLHEVEKDTSLKRLLKKEQSHVTGFAKHTIFVWYFWIFYHLIAISLDFIFRQINTAYASRSVTILENLGNQAYFAILTMVIAIVGQKIHKNYIILQYELTNRFKLKEDIKIGVYHKIFSKRNQIIIWFLSALFVAWSVSLPFIYGIPEGYPDITISYIYEVWLATSSLLTNYLEISLGLMLIYMAIFIIRFPKKIKELELEPKYHDKSGGFKSVSKFLLTLCVIITSVCLVTFIIRYIVYLQSGQIQYVFVVGIIVGIIPVISFLFLFIIPQISYHKLLKSYKFEKISDLWEKKNVVLKETLNEEDMEKQDHDKIEQIQRYNVLISEIEQISDWPFSFSSALKLLSYTLSPLISFFITRLLILLFDF
ncbi:MAG: hypothetical protein GF308_21600 [Candidatus Heimdallarchaeota archaeon]|nr:hypothetical protein [Candidatus Heimdallarchaeota archaeon]